MGLALGRHRSARPSRSPQIRLRTRLCAACAGVPGHRCGHRPASRCGRLLLHNCNYSSDSVSFAGSVQGSSRRGVGRRGAFRLRCALVPRHCTGAPRCSGWKAGRRAVQPSAFHCREARSQSDPFGGGPQHSRFVQQAGGACFGDEGRLHRWHGAVPSAGEGHRAGHRGFHAHCCAGAGGQARQRRRQSGPG